MPAAVNALRVLAALASLQAAGCNVRSGILREDGSPGLAPKGPEAPDFVVGSRKASGLDFLPIGVDAPARPARARTEDSRKALEAELDADRLRTAARGRAAEGAGKSVGKGAKD